MRKFFILSTALLLFSGCALQARNSQDILIGPYVNHVTEHEARILWVSMPDLKEDAALLGRKGKGRIKLPVAISPITDRAEVLHTATVSGLDAGQTYSYVVASGAEKRKGSFHTAPPEGSREPIRFVIYGDTRSHPDRHREVVQSMKKDLPFAFFINTGDLVENGEIWELWTRDFFDPARDLLTRTAVWPVRGNHEEDAVWYRELFDLPNNELYYSFDYGNLHMVVLDCYVNADVYSTDWMMADPEMLRWLEADLAATEAEWIIVTFHVPTFNIGGGASTWGQTDVRPLLEKYGVDLVVNGHSHIYERFRPIGPAGQKPIIYVVSGGGGAPTYPVRPSPILATAKSCLHHCLFTIDGNRLNMTVQTPGGEVIDQVELIKTNGTFQAEVLAAQVTSEDAMNGAFLASTRLQADFTEVPKSGRFTPVTLTALDHLPEESRVQITSAESSLWTVRTANFTATTNLEFQIKVRAPDELAILPGRVEPPFELGIKVTWQGQIYKSEQRSVKLSPNTIRKLMPEPVPSHVPHAARPIVIDGLLDDWKRVKPLHLPSTGEASEAVRLAWSAEGLYLSLDMADDHVEPNPARIWEADGMEFFIEADYARAFDVKKNPAALKGTIHPPGKSSEPALSIDYGPFSKQAGIIPFAGRKNDEGYTVELLIPKQLLHPALLSEGTRMGFHYLLWNDGQAVERFIDTEGKKSVWKTPLYWGAVELAP